ncbi:hypothetical protein, partial [Blautia sp.]|uniref:hypothetical protein n=1 Tax=Blautia sp. TaxID=1955243 RepID=UPI003FD8951F
DATFLWRPSIPPHHKTLTTPPTASPQTNSTFLWRPLYTSNKKAPVPSKYNTARHQSKKNKCQADIHNPLRYLLITE